MGPIGQIMKTVEFSSHFSLKVIYFEYIPGKSMFLAWPVDFARKSAIFAKKSGKMGKNWPKSENFHI